MEIEIVKIAEIIKADIEGDSTLSIHSIAKIEEGIPGTLTFLANPKYESFIYTTHASAVIVNKTFKPSQPIKTTLLKVDDAYKAFSELLSFYSNSSTQKVVVSENSAIGNDTKLGNNIAIGHFSVIGSSCRIGNNVIIHPGVIVGNNVTIDDGTVIFSGVKVYENCKIGKNCIIHAGVVIGSDGFGFAPQGEDYMKVPQIGNVILEDYVEIGSNTTIDRATFGSTVIRRGVKLDNLIQIAHNVEIGENTVIAAQTGIAGSTKIGKNCMIGGQVGIIGHLTIGNNVRIAAQSGIGHNLKDGETVQGSPAFTIGDYRRSYVIFSKLPELWKKVLSLEKSSAK